MLRLAKLTQSLKKRKVRTRNYESGMICSEVTEEREETGIFASLYCDSVIRKTKCNLIVIPCF